MKKIIIRANKQLFIVQMINFSRESASVLLLMLKDVHPVKLF